MTVVCKACDGEGTVLGPYRGVAGCETEDVTCDDCRGSGFVEADDDAADTLEEAAGLR